MATFADLHYAVTHFMLVVWRTTFLDIADVRSVDASWDHDLPPLYRPNGLALLSLPLAGPLTMTLS